MYLIKKNLYSKKGEEGPGMRSTEHTILVLFCFVAAASTKGDIKYATGNWIFVFE